MTKRYCTGFAGSRRVASGELREVALKLKELFDSDETEPLLVFDDETGSQIDLPLAGTVDELTKSVAVLSDGKDAQHGEKAAAPSGPTPASRGPGRPRLGVVAREVTLLPRHWEWLNGQPSGASATLRRLVERARKESSAADRVRQAQEAAYRFMTTMAGNEPGYEEALRAFYRQDYDRFDELNRNWPQDVREYARMLVAKAREAAATVGAEKSPQ
ncbi:MAG: DUF2239 family protein [Limnochordia bacterium]|jgi:hypothetical protein